jgi:hypothetical protein
MWIELTVAAIAVALVGVSISVRAQAERKERYILLAQEAGFKLEDLESSYDAYRENKLAIANLLLWLGIGLFAMGAFTYAFRAA